MEVRLDRSIQSLKNIKKNYIKQDAFNPSTEDDTSVSTTQNRTQSVDLGNTNLDPNSPDYLKIEISDALNEKDKVKFTVKTKTTMKSFKETEFSVIREHEEFVWLHDRFVENEEFAGYIVKKQFK